MVGDVHLARGSNRCGVLVGHLFARCLVRQLLEQRTRELRAFAIRDQRLESPQRIGLAERTREIDALTTIIARLTDTTDAAVRAAGVNPGRVLPIRPVTNGAHHTTLDVTQHP